MTTSAPTRPDGTEMVSVHNVFRDVFDAAPRLIGSVDAADADRVALLSNFYANILSFLSAHHQGEDELVFPRLAARRPNDVETITRINDQHHDVDGAVATSTTNLSAWASGDSAAQLKAAAALGELGQTLGAHLADEEREILPMCEASLSVEEWGELPGHGMAHFTGDKIWLVLGLIRQRMTQAQRDLMLAHMPPPAVQMWTSFGENAFNELMAAVGKPLG
jgi:hemerythrin-like domain-containing protein